MKKVYYNKLIRDNIPDNIRKCGGESSTVKLKSAEYEKELIKKVGEEASGLLSARTKKELIGELADVLDVIDEIKKFKKITSKQMKNAQKNSFKKKGGFKKRLFLYWSSNTGYKTNERTYTQRKN